MTHAFSSLDELGDGPGFRKVRGPLGVTAFGVNGVVYPPNYPGISHYHDTQDELYFVHKGTAKVHVEGEERILGPGGLFHVESTTPRRIESVGDEELVMLVIGGPAASRLTGRDGAAGLLWGLYFLAAAAGAVLIGRWMDRVGRRPGLILSYLLVGAAAAAAAVSIRAGSFAGLMASTIPFGVALGGANLARGAVADMYPAERRGRAVGILLAAGTIGAVGSPLLAAVIEEAAGEGSVLPWVVPIAGAFGALLCALAVSPDPRDLAVVEPSVEPSVDRTRGRSPRDLLRVPTFRTAVLA